MSVCLSFLLETLEMKMLNKAYNKFVKANLAHWMVYPEPGVKILDQVEERISRIKARLRFYYIQTSIKKMSL